MRHLAGFGLRRDIVGIPGGAWVSGALPAPGPYAGPVALPTIPGYELVRLLGSGGMGRVYLGRSLSGRQVAVKVIRPEFAEDAEFRARFRREAAAARRVSGAFTAPLVDADPDGDPPWMATLYIGGASLAERVVSGPALEAGELRSLAAGLAEALRDIHRAGLVHRDLKPSNILLSADGPRVIDFGIARVTGDLRTRTGVAIGTPPFMSPEQVRGAADVGPASDVFSFGSVLVFAVTGRGPFDAHDSFAAAYRVVQEEPDLGDTPDWLRDLVTHCLTKNPVDRPTPLELLVRLRDMTWPGRAGEAKPQPAADAGPTPAHQPPTPGSEPRTAAPVASAGPTAAARSQQTTRTSLPPPVPPPPAAPVSTVATRAGRTGGFPVRRAAVLAAVVVVIATAVTGGLYLSGHRGGGPDAKAQGTASTTTTTAVRHSGTPAAGPATGTATATTSTATATATPGRTGGVTIQVTAAGGSSYLHVTGGKGTTVYNGVLAKGSVMTFTDRTVLKLVIGDAGSVRLVVNGQSLGTAGEPGQIARLTYTPGDPTAG
ncbi:MAG: DUF4115 domain-containing protein [Streptomyces sp.]|nr:DUF4115 domain-containing protein [Streptomyces sp.]